MQLGFLSGLSGEVPASLGRMGQLGYLDISGNMLTGMLPALASSQMVTLRLAENFLSGTIPASYGECCLHHAPVRAFQLNVQETVPGIRRSEYLAPMSFTEAEQKHPGCPGFRATQLREDACTGSMNNLVSMELEGNQLEGTLPTGMLPARCADPYLLLMISGMGALLCLPSAVTELSCHAR